MSDPDNFIDSLMFEAERVGLLRAKYRQEAIARGDDRTEIVRRCYELDRAFDQAVLARKYGTDHEQRIMLEKLRAIV